MHIVLDSNILFSALIKDSTTRKLILEYDKKFLFPAFIFEEIKKHHKDILKKSKMREAELNMLLTLLLEKVEIVSKNSLLDYRDQALEIVKEIDINDAIFFACALWAMPSIIWSDDKKLQKQNVVTVLNTVEIMELFNKKKQQDI